MAAAVPRPLAEVARAQAWVLKPAPAKAAPAQKMATAPETELASALDLALLPAAARAQATDAARADSLASPFKAAAVTTAQALSRQKSRVALLRHLRLPTA